MKLIAVMIASLCLIATSWAQDEHAKDGRKKSMQTQKDTTMVVPALDKYARGAVAELWKRPGLTARDRSIVTIAALIARNQTIEMPYYFNLALDNGVKPREISEIILPFTPAGRMRYRQSPSRNLSLPIVRSGSISFLPLRLRRFRSTKTGRQNEQRLWNSSSVTSLRASCSTPRTFYSATYGCVRILR